MKINFNLNQNLNKSFGMAKLSYPLENLLKEAKIKSTSQTEKEELKKIKQTLDYAFPERTVHSELYTPSILEKYILKNTKPEEIIFVDDEVIKKIKYKAFPSELERLKKISKTILDAYNNILKSKY